MRQYYFLSSALLANTIEAQQCGQSFSDPVPASRMIGGVETDLSTFPWLAHLYTCQGQTPCLPNRSDPHNNGATDGNVARRCYATLISDTWLLTHNTCVDDEPVQDLIITVGRNVREATSNPADTALSVDKRVAQVLNHPDYVRRQNGVFMDNMISLIQLDSPVTFNQYVQPICIFAADYDLTNEVSNILEGSRAFYIADWGNTDEDGYSYDINDNVLQSIDVRLINWGTCNNDYFSDLDDRMGQNDVCAGLVEGGRNVCNSVGTPLMVQQSNGAWGVFGIHNWQKDLNMDNSCETQYSPIVYQRVSPYADWIQSVTGVVPIDPAVFDEAPAVPTNENGQIEVADGLCMETSGKAMILVKPCDASNPKQKFTFSDGKLYASDSLGDDENPLGKCLHVRNNRFGLKRLRLGVCKGRKRIVKFKYEDGKLVTEDGQVPLYSPDGDADHGVFIGAKETCLQEFGQ